MSAEPNRTGPATLQPYAAARLPEITDLWVRAWEIAYPAIDFNARRGWFAEHMRRLAEEGFDIRTAAVKGQIVGLLAIHPGTGYLDQIVVATEYTGQGIAAQLLAEAKQVSPRGIGLHVNQDNERAIAFYRKHGFAVVGSGTNPNSTRPVFAMEWRSSPVPSSAPISPNS